MGPRTEPPRYAARELLSFSAVGWFSNVASNWMTWADTILLGIYLSPTAVSAYQVATRLALLSAVVIGPLATSLAPRAADLYRRQRLDLLQRAYVAVTGWTIRLYLLGFVMLITFPRELLSIFGPAFPAAAPVIVILASAQLVNAATGPCGYLLTMTGRVGGQLVLNLTSLATNVALNLWLIPRHGIIGAAVAWATCLVVFNLIRVTYVHSAMGMWPFDRQIVKTVLAALAALGAAAAIARLVEGFLGVVVAMPIVTLVYAGLLTIARIGPEDRLVLASLRHRVRSGNA